MLGYEIWPVSQKQLLEAAAKGMTNRHCYSKNSKSKYDLHEILFKFVYQSRCQLIDVFYRATFKMGDMRS